MSSGGDVLLHEIIQKTRLLPSGSTHRPGSWGPTWALYIQPEGGKKAHGGSRAGVGGHAG